jgi:hypothetical protein
VVPVEIEGISIRERKLFSTTRVSLHFPRVSVLILCTHSMLSRNSTSFGCIWTFSSRRLPFHVYIPFGLYIYPLLHSAYSTSRTKLMAWRSSDDDGTRHLKVLECFEHSDNISYYNLFSFDTASLYTVMSFMILGTFRCRLAIAGHLQIVHVVLI